MGTSRLAFWAGVVGFVRRDSRDVWCGVLQGLYRQNFMAGSTALCAESHFQFGFHADTVRPQKQSAGESGHSAGGEHAHLGTRCRLVRIPGFALGGLCQYSLSFVGHICDRFAIDHHLSQRLKTASRMFMFIKLNSNIVKSGQKGELA